MFFNKEEILIEPFYRDPVHDFGIFRFNPLHVKHDLVEIQLNPAGAIVGTNICVLGNDGGEKQIVLPGILGRVDREAPHYDANTFYMAAANNTSGGSSGSPVLACDGSAIGNVFSDLHMKFPCLNYVLLLYICKLHWNSALNSGGKFLASTSYFYPLDSVVRALDFIRKSLVVPRGDLFAIFKHNSFAEVCRFGVPEFIIDEVKSSVEAVNISRAGDFYFIFITFT